MPSEGVRRKGENYGMIDEVDVFFRRVCVSPPCPAWGTAGDQCDQSVMEGEWAYWRRAKAYCPALIEAVNHCLSFQD